MGWIEDIMADEPTGSLMRVFQSVGDEFVIDGPQPKVPGKLYAKASITTAAAGQLYSVVV
jgi:hypothetical protein